MDIRSAVIAVIAVVAKQQNAPLAPLHDTLPLLESGLDSLCMAIIVVRLEEEFDVDPFNTEEDFDFPVTVGDLITLYERAVAKSSA